RDLVVHPSVLQRGHVELSGAADVLYDGALPQLVGGGGDDVDDDPGGLRELVDDAAVAAGGGVEGRVDQQRDLFLRRADRGSGEGHGGQQGEGTAGGERVPVSGHLVPFGSAR